MTLSGLKPGDTACSRTKLRTSRPAPMSSISEMRDFGHDEQAAQPAARAAEAALALRVPAAGLERRC